MEAFLNKGKGKKGASKKQTSSKEDSSSHFNVTIKTASNLPKSSPSKKSKRQIQNS